MKNLLKVLCYFIKFSMHDYVIGWTLPRCNESGCKDVAELVSGCMVSGCG